jgi:hypothetical protein
LNPDLSGDREEITGDSSKVTPLNVPKLVPLVLLTLKKSRLSFEKEI